MPCHATHQVHSCYEPSAPHLPVVPPIHQTTAFRFPDHATAASMFRLETPGFTYSRTGNPTVAVFENRLAALEGGIGTIATATGQAAVALSLLALLQVKRPVLRASFTLLTWAGLLGLCSQAEIWRVSDNPLTGAFWSSHYWSGVLLTGLLLFNLAARPEIIGQLRLVGEDGSGLLRIDQRLGARPVETTEAE